MPVFDFSNSPKKKDEEFKAEIDKSIQGIKTGVDNKIASRLPVYVEELHRLAMTSSSEKVKKDVLEYLLNRVLGTPTRVQQDITEDTNKEDNSINIDDIVQGIELKEAK